MFDEFLGKEVKIPYMDGDQYKIARGILEEISEDFIKVKGERGVLIVNIKCIRKIALAKK
jgi:hypothetical protein